MSDLREFPIGEEWEQLHRMAEAILQIGREVREVELLAKNQRIAELEAELQQAREALK